MRASLLFLAALLALPSSGCSDAHGSGFPWSRRPSAAAVTYSSTILADSPQHFWRLKEGTVLVGATFPDAAGGGVTAAITTSNALSGPSIVTSEAASFDNDVNSYLTLSSAVTFAGDFTIEGWIKPLGGPYAGGAYKTALLADTTSNNGIVGSSDNWQAAIGGTSIIIDGATISYGSIYYLAWTRSGTTNTLYKGTGGSLSTIGTASAAGSVPINFIGYVGCCGVNHMQISDVATWTSALSAGTLTNHYNAGK